MLSKVSFKELQFVMICLPVAFFSGEIFLIVFKDYINIFLKKILYVCYKNDVHALKAFSKY